MCNLCHLCMRQFYRRLSCLCSIVIDSTALATPQLCLMNVASWIILLPTLKCTKYAESHHFGACSHSHSHSTYRRIFAPLSGLLLAMFRQSYCLFFTLAVAVLVQTIPASGSSNQWPYRQIYPPVNDSDDRTRLFYAVVLSFGGDYTSIGALPGVQIALDYINSEPSILPGYTLHYTLMDSQVWSFYSV